MGRHRHPQGDAVALSSSRKGKDKGQAETPAPALPENTETVAAAPAVKEGDASGSAGVAGQAVAPAGDAAASGAGAAPDEYREDPAADPVSAVATHPAADRDPAPDAPSATDMIADFLSAAVTGGESQVRMRITPARDIRRAGRQWIAGKPADVGVGDIPAALLPAVIGEPAFHVEWIVHA